MKIPDRITIRLNENERFNLKILGECLNEHDLSKIIKFGIDTATHHIKYVTNALIDPGWEVIFQRKRKTQETKRRIY